MTIQQLVHDRNIDVLYHFTHSDNLASILTHGLVSRANLDNRGLAHASNDEIRIDGHLNATCLSVSFPNSKMFYKYRMLRPGDWVIVAVSPRVLWAKNCAFYPVNAASNLVRFKELAEMQGGDAFSSMFAEHVGGIERGDTLPIQYTTDVQAEVLVFDDIGIDCFLCVYHPNKACAERFVGLNADVEHRYYANTSGKTLYSQRDFYLG